MSPAIAAFLKIESGLFAMAMVPALIYAFSKNLSTGFLTFLVCFMVPQPFLLYAFKDILRSKK